MKRAMSKISDTQRYEQHGEFHVTIKKQFTHT